jgi:PAS domain S-box-containing protein
MLKSFSLRVGNFFKVGKFSALKISLLYFIFGALWIWTTDKYFNSTIDSYKGFFMLSVAKGLLFITVTSLFLFVIFSFQNRQILKKHTQIDETERRYMLLFESNPIPMWVYDLHTFRFLVVNNAAIEIYGYSREEFLSMQIFDIRPKEDLDDLMENIQNDPNKKYAFSGKWRHMKKNGEVFFVEINSHPINYQGKKAKLVLASDISKRVQTEEEIQAVVGELNNFVYRASHDIRGPIARLIGLSHLVKTDKSGDIQHYNQLIYSTALLLDSILQRLLSVNTLKECEPTVKRIDLHGLTKDAIQLIKGNFDPCRLNFINEIRPGFTVESDEKILFLVLENLIQNCAEYCDDSISNPFVKISAEYKKGFYSILVSDNGMGIPDKIKSKIFDMFYRGTERSKGSGLGLYICKIAMKKLDGDVQLKSSSEHETVFEITFPGPLTGGLD